MSWLGSVEEQRQRFCLVVVSPVVDGDPSFRVHYPPFSNVGMSRAKRPVKSTEPENKIKIIQNPELSLNSIFNKTYALLTQPCCLYAMYLFRTG